ncbi:hypothetical protein [Romboutsia sp. 1001216sp1]|uniref:hypothetical protein n=1 Tax=Romboutsia sp. 1001216sp1 TaxID=2986997 RepID=UPI00232D8EE1|nr:hypothetical protein [Romboutsia sp. 1001216sp1]MDB8803718.1 hypothetical protein [Romboutsia sp. 1001216sp1]MDB8806932.1 hypothetical protein [Romboutsia sp. 1001216sp1]MDB8809365.1 hypothetical protein [Romboutsia sp. 1001216sp1]MDB8815114.1 hypothetical protein [Romboutsia sp. 1001216sp1]MDB8817807.1 hypothetical protein [Romboutsia sp. 1001216sp1]
MRIAFIIFGIILTLWGIHRMKTDDAFFGKSQADKNIFNLILMGEASGLGQFLGGVLCIVIGIISFIIK